MTKHRYTPRSAAQQQHMARLNAERPGRMWGDPKPLAARQVDDGSIVGELAQVVRPRLRRISLSTLRDVRLELASLYRRMDNGDIESADGTKRAYVLRQIADVITLAELEDRIQRLETGTIRALPALKDDNGEDA